MRYKRLLINGFVLILSCLALQAQAQEYPLHILRAEQGQILHAELHHNHRIAIDQSIDFVSQVYGLSKAESFVPIRSIGNESEEFHLRLQHTVAGVPVKGSELICHFNAGLLESFNGRLYSVESAQPELAADKARELAIASVGEAVFSWTLKEEEAMLKLWKEDSTASYFPQGELYYVPKDLDFKQEYSLCYSFEINAVDPLIRREVFVHAISGEIWASQDLIHVTDVPGTANTRFRGLKNITTDSVSPGVYRLRETGRGGGIETYDMNQGTNYAAAVDFTDADNYWNNYNAQYDEVAADAHFGAEMTYDYFKDNFNRNSFDDNGAKIRSYVHYRPNYVNAFWNGSVMTYGDGNGTTVYPLTSIDVCGHEIAHAVTTNSANLVYRWESGALNESFSDIFGNAVERFADSNQFNWRIGEDIIASGNGIRNMANPNTHGDPDTYLGTYWHTAASDNGGVHTNSGVQNYWFYLLSEGGSGTNDNSDAFTVDSLGIYKAEAIAYRNLTVYLNSASQYADARYYGIKSAEDLFGACSDEVIATTNAWYAVGVGDEYDSSLVIAEFTADTSYCFGSESVQFINLSTNAKAFQWSFGDNSTSSLRDPSHSYGTQGQFTVELIAESCFDAMFDTITKVNYIQIDSTQDICNAVFMSRGQWDTVYSCNTFVYDHSGEEDYTNLVKDTLTIVFAPSDSAHLTFSEFFYETDWDSLYIYDGYSPAAPLIGGYTGNTLPNAGNPILLSNGAVTLVHFSDPFVVELGFKAFLKSFRPPLSLQNTPDTLVCYGQNLQLQAQLSGGHQADHAYWWNGVKGDSTLDLTVWRDTTIYLSAGDICTEEFLFDSIVISVRDTLKIDAIPDTTLCYLETIDLIATGSGGLASAYVFRWLPMGSTANPLSMQFRSDTVLSVTLSDGCTQQMDSISFNVFVRDSISYVQSQDTTICQGGSARFQVDILNGGIRPIYFTSTLNSSPTVGTIPQPSFWLTQGSGLAPGNHDYWISWTDQCTETFDTAHWTLRIRDSLSLISSVDTTLCYGTSATISAVGSGGLGSNYTYTWTQGLANQSSHLVNPISSTTYQVQLSDGCSGYEPTDSIIITVLDSLELNISGPDIACFDEPLVFTAIASGGRTSTYVYDWDNGLGNLPMYSNSFTADANVILQLTDGCTPQTAEASKNVQVRPALQLLLRGDTAICLGDDILLEATPSGGLSSAYDVQWNNGLGTGLIKTVSPIITTTYTAVLSDNCSASDRDSVLITVNPKPLVDFDLSPNPQCTELEVVFNNQTPTGSGSSFVWDFGDGNNSIAEDPIHIYNLPGIFDIQLVVTNEFNCTDSLLRAGIMDVVAHPVADFSFNPLKANFFEPDFDFSNESNFATDYFWTFGDGGSSTDSDPSYSYSDTGVYTVSLEASNSLGCTEVVSYELLVEDVFLLHIPNAFSPNQDGKNDEFRIYTRGLMEYNITVFNRWGEVLWQKDQNSSSWDGKFKGEYVSEGIYFYLLNGRDFEGLPVERKGEIMLLR